MRQVTLTFDDGPTEYTPQILDILKKEKIQSAFFVLGKNFEKNSKIIERELNEGHIVGNHGFSHNRITSPL